MIVVSVFSFGGEGREEFIVTSHTSLQMSQMNPASLMCKV